MTPDAGSSTHSSAAAERPIPTEDEVLGWFDSLSNWGRWGDDDELGTINLITPKATVAAARLVRDGFRVSCAWNISTGKQIGDWQRPLRYMIESGFGPCGHESEPPARWKAAEEFLAMAYHGPAITHIDSLAHFFWDGKMYGGRSAELVTEREGARVLDVASAAVGLSGRGVLLDIPALLGTDSVPADYPVMPDDLERAAELVGVSVGAGDILVMRTGEGLRRQRGEFDPFLPHSGFQAACLPWFHDRGVAAIATDLGQDVLPSGYDSLPNPIHTVGIVAMGLWLIDNCQLEDLRAACIARKRWEFQLTIAPLRFEGTTGCPVNPIAVF